MGLLSELFEKRAHPSQAINWALYGFWGYGNESYTGITVSEENMLDATAVWAAVRTLAETIASLPLHLYERLKPRGKKRATEHPLYPVLHIKPNPEMTSMVYRETIAGHVVMWGTSYSEIDRDGYGAIRALWPLLPGNMDIKRFDGELTYVYRLPDGSTKMFDTDSILRISGFSKNGLIGYSPVNVGREAIGLSLALEEFGARFFGNGAKPPIALEHPEALSPEAYDRLRESWEKRHEGLSNAHRVAILEEGMKLKEFGVSPEDAQALESRKFQVTEVARIFNVPPHMLKDLEKSTFSNIEHQGLEFVIYTIRPWLVRFEQAYSMQLLTEQELNTYFFEHLVDGLLRGDMESRSKAYATGRQWGWWSANDVREMENQNPVDGGDIYLVPLNMAPTTDFVSQTNGRVKNRSIEQRTMKPPVGRDRVARVYYPLFVDAAQRIINKETIAIKRATKKHLKQRDLKSLNEWITKFYEQLPKDVQKSMRSVMWSYISEIQAMVADEVGAEIGMTPELEQFAQEYLDTYTARYISSSLGQLQALIRDIAPEELEGMIIGRSDEWQEKRADKIATRETVQLSSAVANTVFFATVGYCIWRTRGPKTCPYCQALEGRKIVSGDYFVEEGNWEPSGADNGPMKIRGIKRHPPLHAGCDCFPSAF